MDSRHNMDQTIVISRRERIATGILSSLILATKDQSIGVESLVDESLMYADALIKRLDGEGEMN